MNDKPKIIIGLIVLVVAVTFPFWNRLIKAIGEPPAVELPKDEKYCVQSKEWMIANHMNLLDTWRNDVVRSGNRTYRDWKGEDREMSLTKTCMSAECHASRAQFCDKCHTYADVKPYCWDCHVTPDQVGAKGE